MCWSANVAWTFFFKQYFYNRDGVSVAPSIGDIIIDAGACFGDTAICFADAVGPTGHVHAFEFVPIHLEIILKNLQLNPVLSDRITVHSVAMGTVDSEP